MAGQTKSKEEQREKRKTKILGGEIQGKIGENSRKQVTKGKIS